jgi:hypothetical protein
VRLEGLGQLKNPVTSSGIEPANGGYQTLAGNQTAANVRELRKCITLCPKLLDSSRNCDYLCFSFVAGTLWLHLPHESASYTGLLANTDCHVTGNVAAV